MNVKHIFYFLFFPWLGVMLCVRCTARGSGIKMKLQIMLEREKRKICCWVCAHQEVEDLKAVQS